MSLIPLGADLLSTIEAPYDSEGAWLVLPDGNDTEATVDLLVRDAIGSREVELLLLDRRIEDTQRALEVIVARGRVTWDERTGEPERHVPPEGWPLERSLEHLAARRKSLMAELAALRGPEGPDRARKAMARFRVVGSEELHRALREAGEAPVLALTNWTYGVCETMEERLHVRGWTLGLPDDHEETVLREEERGKWENLQP